MELNTNFVDINTIKANAAQKYNNVDTSKLEDKKLREVTDNFESFFLQQMLDISLKNTNFAGDSSGSDIIKGMYTEAVAKESAGTFGISDMLYNFLSNKK